MMDPKGRLAEGLGELRMEGQGTKEYFLHEGGFMLRPGTQGGFYGGRHFRGRNEGEQGHGSGTPGQR